jgi:hypothetical protein
MNGFDNTAPRVQTGNKAPCWRKPKQEIIDEKVERLFESYKLMDDLTKKRLALGGVTSEE